MSQTQLKPTVCPKCGESSQERDTGQHAFCEECGYVSASSISEIERGPTPRPQTIRLTTNSQSSVLGMSELTVRWGSIARPSDQTQRNFAASLSEVARIVLQLNLPREIAIRASELCRAAFERHLTRGRTITITSASAVYAACRLSAMPITVKEMAEELKLPYPKLAPAITGLTRELKLTFPHIDVQSYVSKLLDSLGLGPGDLTSQIVNSLLTDLKLKKAVRGRNPVSIGCAIVYLSSIIAGSRKTQRQICKVSHVTETTVRLACRMIEHACPHLLLGV